MSFFGWPLGCVHALPKHYPDLGGYSVTLKTSGTACPRRGASHNVADAWTGYLASWRYADAPGTSEWSPRQAGILKDQGVGYS